MSSRRDWVDGGGLDDDGEPNPIPEPALFRTKPTEVRPGPAKVKVLQTRHQLRAGLWHDDDAEPAKPIDWIANLTNLGLAIREAILAERGVRWGAEGIKLVNGETPDDPPRWRCQIWNPGTKGKGGHIHLGYAKSRGEAVDMIADWYRRYCGFDVRIDPPEWFKELISDALAVQSRASEQAGGLAWDVDG